jgi:fructan beta-fructosidase
MNIRRGVLIIYCFLWPGLLIGQKLKDSLYHEPFRLQYHFSPKEHWLNDPNGMVYYKGIYHLFFQYHPYSISWGPMHWGHAESSDLIHWKQLPIALYPDSLGFIFSGSAVWDRENTSGLGKKGEEPLVALFTQSDPLREKKGRDDFQNQSMAYSLDHGLSWIRYKGNPVLRNPGIRDFRDPKLTWYAPGKKWIMTLATQDHISFFSSKNLKSWNKESEVGKDFGAHGGVWECPDLFPLRWKGKEYWVLIVNMNPGGPNGGSATQYFIGKFDGQVFVPLNTKTHWLDYGPDEYAGITWSNTGDRKIFLGWMSNWLYAGQLPTQKWRNGMTLPRDLSLNEIDGDILLASNPVKEIHAIELKPIPLSVSSSKDLFWGLKPIPTRFKLEYRFGNQEDYSIILRNDLGEELVFGYDQSRKSYFIDRTHSGITQFNPDFGKIYYSPRVSLDSNSRSEVFIDNSSIEFFNDQGLSIQTALFFPNKPFNQLFIKTREAGNFKDMHLIPLKSIW